MPGIAHLLRGVIRLHSLLEDLDDQHREQLIRCDQPDWMEPMLATLADRRFPDSDWIFERKFDGERCLVFCTGNSVRLLSRNRKRLNDTYPELEKAFLGIGDDRFIADGEIVAFEGGATRFSRLQDRMQIQDRRKADTSSVAVYLYLFDLMFLDCCDLCSLDLRTRKSLLKQIVSFDDPIRFTNQTEGDGLACYREACAKGWEGIIAKRAAGRYVHRRSKDWLKFKCVSQQEFVIGGYTEGGGSRTGFGALLLGYYRGDDLHYAGKVGTGFDDRTVRDLARQLASRQQDSTPFADKMRLEKGEHFVSPDLVCEVAFSEWTGEGKLRHPRFLGLRDDKPARDVVRERSAGS